MYKHLSSYERDTIARYYKEGLTYVEIGKLLNRHHTTIAREIKRNSTIRVYNPAIAQETAEKRQKRKKNACKACPELLEYIAEKLMMTWSPASIVGYMEYQEGYKIVSTRTIYRWIYNGLIITEKKEAKRYLRRKGKKYHSKQGKYYQAKLKRSIHDRPRVIERRLRVGDWEVDTIESRKGITAGVVTLVDRKTRFLKATLVSKRTAQEVSRAMIRLLADEYCYSITADNGSEFHYFKEVEERLKIDKVYFADPKSPWQRGSNELANGLLREFFPKGTDFSKVSEKALQEAVRLINHRPVELFNYRSRYQMYYQRE